MTRWSNCECQTFYEDSREAASQKCEVVIAAGRIAVDTRHIGGGWMYDGEEAGSGHYRLESKTHQGRGTLHHNEAEDALEGWWHEDGISGMWRITLAKGDE